MADESSDLVGASDRGVYAQFCPKGCLPGRRSRHPVVAGDEGDAQRNAADCRQAAYHYTVEDAKAVGIEQFFFVTSRAKSAIDDHFDCTFELEATLLARGKTELVAELEARLPERGQIG